MARSEGFVNGNDEPRTRRVTADLISTFHINSRTLGYIPTTLIPNMWARHSTGFNQIHGSEMLQGISGRVRSFICPLNQSDTENKNRFTVAENADVF